MTMATEQRINAAQRASAELTRMPNALPTLQPLSFDDLEGFAEDDHRAAFALFAAHAAAIVNETPVLRPALSATPDLRALFRKALAAPSRDDDAARLFFEENFLLYRVLDTDTDRGFLTGYYEPVVEGSLNETREFRTPVYGRPDDLVTLASGETAPGVPSGLSAARRNGDGSFSPYPDRTAIEGGALKGHATPLLYLADPVEVFYAQVQGSARVRLRDRREVRLTYAGRNGHPYTSIGRILVESGEIARDKIGLESVKAWIRANGRAPGEAGHALMARNTSYVFFALNADLPESAGPIGGAGLSLTPLRSIAIDRNIWSYGLPFWIAADLPWQSAKATPFRRLMIASDTGSAIVGPARADLFFGSGEAAGALAGNIRHGCDFIVLLPRDLRDGT
jgi:membrane-bound lytic murein transglycosylase A